MTDKIVKTISTSNWTGIQGDIVLPTSFSVDDNGSDYFNFYIGFGLSYMEGGISYSEKWPAGEEWHKFLNNGGTASNGDTPQSDPLSNQPSPGDRIHLKLVNNSDGTATLYVNGYLAYTLKSASSMPSTTYIKMAQGAGDYSGNVTYSQTDFSLMQYRDSNNVWHDWTSGSSTDYSKKSSDMSVYSELPLSTSLS